ncbi:hypothetical protein ScPMuIL_000915 [Solemya velum]
MEITNDTHSLEPSRPSPSKPNLSPKASAFSIAAIIGEDIYTEEKSRSPSPLLDLRCAKTPDPIKDERSITSENSAFRSVKTECDSSPEPEQTELSDVKCRLETKELWEKFNELGTEMIITKSGRRMFPTVRVSFSGLEPDERYIVLMDIVPVDNKRYRYAYHRSSWLVAGKADPPLHPRLCLHPDSPFTGEQLQKQTISFEKLKLTNNVLDKNSHVILNSMHKYQPRLHLMKKRDDTPLQPSSLEGQEYRSFVFPETVFIGVTAYQNQLITKLKIDSNPFAKGFRDSTRLTEFERDTMEHMMQNHSYARSPLRTYSDAELEESMKQRDGFMKENLGALQMPFLQACKTSPPAAHINSDRSLYSLYGSMVGFPVYGASNSEQLLRSQLYKSSLQQAAFSGLYQSHMYRYHPYMSSEKMRTTES